ncbi:MAG TPA: glycosyltransferase family 39 protein [Vicinamibacterales bacterium]|nr:glycosyltransferase family 39 protein [Vicinamibacterales bacterium]
MAEREWREARDMRRSIVGLALVLLVAALLRFWHLATGLPAAALAGERDLLSRVVHTMAGGGFNPGSFDSPSLFFYVQLLVACLHFLTGAANGLWTSVAAFQVHDTYHAARVASAVIGVATVLVVYQAGARWGGRHALLAAGLLAVLPDHVRASHYALPDVATTFWTALTLVLTLRALERDSLQRFIWAGVAAGLAGATTYRGGLTLLLPLVAVWMSSATGPSRLAKGLGAAGAAVAAYLLAAPYTVLDLPGFLNAAAANLAGAAAGGPERAAVAAALLATLQWPALLLALAGFGLGLVRSVTGPGHARWVLLVSFPIVYLGSMAIGRTGRPETWLLPVLPYVVILTAIAVISGVSLLRRFSIPRAVRQGLITALTVAALLPPLLASIRTDRTLGRPPVTEGGNTAAPRDGMAPTPHVP